MHSKQDKTAHWLARGLKQHRQGNALDAERLYRRVLKANPNHVDACNLLGTLYMFQGRHDQALELIEKARTCQPRSSAILCNLGLLHEMRGDAPLAESTYLDAIDCTRPVFEAFLNLGNLLIKDRRPMHARRVLEQGIEHYPRRPEFLLALARALHLSAENRQALSLCLEVTSITPDDLEAYLQYFFLTNYTDDDVDSVLEQLSATWKKARERVGIATVQLTDAPSEREEPLRIGLVSPDFRQHSCSYFIAPLLEHLDRDQFHVTCYSNSSMRDDVTDRLQAWSDNWREIASLDDLALVDRIRSDHIDVLFDLVGHTAGNRLWALARQPAPLQISWLGYPGTCAVESIQWRLTDPMVDPPGEPEGFHTEALWRMEAPFLCYRPHAILPALASSRLPRRDPVLGSFNNYSKLSDTCLDAWGAVLGAMPEASLRIKSRVLMEQACWEQFLHRMALRGVDRERIQVVTWKNDPATHLHDYLDIDIALDSYPYSGTTTTFEALLMGVPVVTLRGKRHASRVTASILTCLGLDPLIANDTQSFVTAVKQLARGEMRHMPDSEGLRQALLASDLCDGPSFARRFSAAVIDINNMSRVNP